jgi:signal transduction histidine kinase
LLIILGVILYGAFTNVLIDYIKQDLVLRGNNHARILNEQFTESAINHVTEMEKGVATEVLITDANQKILGSSSVPTNEMKASILDKSLPPGDSTLVDDWYNEPYLVSASTIGDGTGYVYMYYPSSNLREIVFVLSVLLILTGIGILLLAFGLIGLASKRITRPLKLMKKATEKMAKGEYKQHFTVNSKDEIAELSQSIQTLGDQLQYFEDSRNDFLAAVSHELRTPLTYIKGYSDILGKGNIDKEDQKVYLDIIKKEVQRITFMVNDLFEMSKLQVGEFELNKEIADIQTVIEKVVNNLKPAATKKNISVILDFQPDLPPVEIDVKRMEQVFYNLIENGIKYSNEGKMSIRAFAKEDFIAIEIEDTGIGIPEKDLPKIWDRFYRVEQSRTRKSGGTGLGLYVSKKIIESHDGTVHVTSKVNAGSVFKVILKKAKIEEIGE